MVIEPGLFVGTLRHRRFAPVAHEFTYRTFMALIDVDRIDEQMAVSRWTSHNRWNWASFDDRDHLGDARLPLRHRLAWDASGSGIDLPSGRILLLTHLRYWGYCFNPVSFYYCFDRSGELRLVLAEVNNTFGGTHNYWLRPDATSRTFRATAEKSLYVSPFMPVDLDYGFAFTPPLTHLVAHMEALRHRSVVFDATLSLHRKPWTAAEIRRQLIRRPMATAQVVAGIHWQAFNLWRKGVPVVPRATATGEQERLAWNDQHAEREAVKEQYR